MDDKRNLIFGKKAILDAIKNGLSISCIKCLKNHPEIKRLLPNVKLEIVDQKFFNKFNDINHQNIIAIIDQKINHLSVDELFLKAKDKDKFTVLMIDECQDPRNFGSIIRTSAAFGTDAIVYKNKNQVPINDLVIKSSMGAVYFIDFVKVANLNQAIDKFKGNGFWVYSTGLVENAQSIDKVEFANKIVIVVGNENDGVSNLTLQKSDFVVTIPMTNKVQSLNISIATGIVLNKRFNQKY